MNKKLLNTGVQDFISENLNADIVSVLLKKPLFEGISQKELAQQIESKKKCQKKLPTWFNTPEIYYPKKINIEQTSSEITAKYKSELVSGNLLIDLTGGLGIDSYYFSKKMSSIFHCEIDKELHEITTHNYKILGSKNIKTFESNGLEILKKIESEIDWIYIDPSRRNKSKGKVFQLSDCEPDVIKNLHLLFSKSENILIKTSPLLDISQGIKNLNWVKDIHIISINNDVKELVWVLKKGFSGDTAIKTINFTNKEVQSFNFNLLQEKHAVSTFGAPLQYIYEPNSSILKAGAFKSLGVKFDLLKLHPHTHLYTSNKLIDFPGRSFKLLKLIPYNKKGIKELNLKNANITKRNFSDSVQKIREKYRIKEGGDSYLFFFRNFEGQPQIANCVKAHK